VFSENAIMVRNPANRVARLGNGDASPGFTNSVISLAVVVLAVFLLTPSRWLLSQEYTPASAEVIEMVEKGLKYLETTSDHEEAGGNALIGLTLLRNGYDKSNPRVARAISKCALVPQQNHNYSLALVLIFLCELDPQKYNKLIDACITELLKRQKAHGFAWTYEGARGGDTSQTQYGILALWTAYQHGFRKPEIEQSLTVALRWLLRTQDPSGGWGYHGQDPGAFRRMPQTSVSLSLTAAGLGSVYVCANLLGLPSANIGNRVRRDLELPPALVPVEKSEPEAPGGRVSSSINTDVLHPAQTDGHRWLNANLKIELERWTYYYLYALERYESFRELAEGSKESSPDWYNAGVEWLHVKQLKSGAWSVSEEWDVGTDLGTAFAILFLTRSTKKSLGLLSEGTLKGGVGLPSNTSSMALHGGRIVAADVTRSLAELVGLLEEQEKTELADLIKFSSELAILPSDPAEYQAHVERLRRLAGHATYEVRMLAVRTLAKTRDFDNVPVLIYALSDPDPRVAREAELGLRFVSRKLEGFGRFDPAQTGGVIAKWKEWYLSIRPDAEFLDSR
jgi:hypothetical protein